MSTRTRLAQLEALVREQELLRFAETVADVKPRPRSDFLGRRARELRAERLRELSFLLAIAERLPPPKPEAGVVHPEEPNDCE